jgi:hypothetical protein
MKTKHGEVIIGVFANTADAREAIEELRDADFSANRVGILVHDRDGDDHVKSIKDMSGNEMGKGAAAGAAVGAGGGALWALGIAAGLLPAIGPVVAGGLLGAVLASAGAGLTVGAVAGSLVGLGISDEEAAYYDEEFRRGNTIVVAQPKDEEEMEAALRIMRESNSSNRYQTGIGYEPRPSI